MLPRDGLPRKQREMLEDDAAIRPRAGDLLAIDQDRTGLHRQKAADKVEQRRLAATGWAEQRDKLAVGHLERNLIEGKHLAPARRAIQVVDAVDNDLRCGHGDRKRP